MQEINHDTKPKFSSFTIIIGFLVLFIIGVSFLPLLNVKFTPSNNQKQISVSYSWAKASSRILENEVTSKLEGVFSSLKNLKKISSSSTSRGGFINMSFDKDTDIDILRFEVLSLIRQVHKELPSGLSYPQINSGRGGQGSQILLAYSINGSAPPRFIQNYAEDNIASRIALIPGISDVRVSGAMPFEWVLTYDYNKVKTLGLNLGDISQAIRSYFNRVELGVTWEMNSIKKAHELYQIFISVDHQGKFYPEKIPVKKCDGRIIYLSDIVSVQYKEKEPDRYFRINGLNSININIQSANEANQLELAKRVKEQIAKIQAELHAGYSITQSYDSSEYIQNELEKISWRIGLSIFILLLFVFLISRQWSYLLLIVISLLANLAIAAIFYYLFKIEIHIYALAGITVSLGMIMDNSIVTIDSIRYTGNNRSFIAILAATLTTIGSLSIIFFLSEWQKLKLLDFAMVMIINLLVSLALALFFMPAIMDKIKIKRSVTSKKIKRKKRILSFNRLYRSLIMFQTKFRPVFIILLILLFGLPFHLLPNKLGERDVEPNAFEKLYNNTFGSDWYNTTARPVVDKTLGGTFRLFTEYVYEQSTYSEPERTKLMVRGSMPKGGTLRQLDASIRFMENYISRFDEIDQFQSSINSPQNGSIEITFTKQAEKDGFPFQLKGLLTSYAINRGGMDWSVYGVGRGFSNSLGSGFKNGQIKLTGYNYEELYALCENVKSDLEGNKRVKDIDIVGSVSWNSSLRYEYGLDLSSKQIVDKNFNLGYIHTQLNEMLSSSSLTAVFDGSLQSLRIISGSRENVDIWKLKNYPLYRENNILKLKDIAKIKKEATGNEIHKENQEYQLYVVYDFIGPHKLNEMLRGKQIEKTMEELPLGYKVQSPDRWMSRADEKNSVLLLALVLVIIFFICAILFESLKQPLAVIATIPISFIGVFLTFYLFDFNFDQGGYASFVLLCGISVNSTLYIINEKNILTKGERKFSKLRLYIKAYNRKIIPILLTTISTILGLVPFAILGQNEVFWFSLSVGAIGGLLFSLFAIVFCLPLFIKCK